MGTVARMERIMSAREYLYWTRYYAVQSQRAELEQKMQGAKRR